MGNYTVGPVIYLFNTIAAMAMTFVSFILACSYFAFLYFLSQISTFAETKFIRHSVEKKEDTSPSYEV